jgi:mRNA interferase YafQ
MTKRKRKIHRTARYKRGYALAEKQGKDTAFLDEIIDLLADDMPLPDGIRDHKMEGKLKDFRECHIKENWMLIYKKTDNDELLLILQRLRKHGEK